MLLLKTLGYDKRILVWLKSCSSGFGHRLVKLHSIVVDLGEERGIGEVVEKGKYTSSCCCSVLPLGAMIDKGRPYSLGVEGSWRTSLQLHWRVGVLRHVEVRLSECRS